MSAFASIEACVFDAYGTLFEAHSAVGEHRERLGGDADRVSSLWCRKQLEYTWLVSWMPMSIGVFLATRPPKSRPSIRS
jgi:2-haloacid dehalogenase